MKIENGISLRTFLIDFKVMVGSWRSVSFPGGTLMLINYTLFFLPFSNLLKTTKPTKSQMKCFGCFQVAKSSSVLHLQFLLAWLFSGMLLGALCLGFSGEWTLSTASSETPWAAGSFPAKSQQQDFSFELVHVATISPHQAYLWFWYFNAYDFCINQSSLLLDCMLLLVLYSPVLSMGPVFAFLLRYSFLIDLIGSYIGK